MLMLKTVPKKNPEKIPNDLSKTQRQEPEKPVGKGPVQRNMMPDDFNVSIDIALDIVEPHMAGVANKDELVLRIRPMREQMGKKRIHPAGMIVFDKKYNLHSRLPEVQNGRLNQQAYLVSSSCMYHPYRDARNR